MCSVFSLLTERGNDAYVYGILNVLYGYEGHRHSAIANRWLIAANRPRLGASVNQKNVGEESEGGAVDMGVSPAAMCGGC